MHFQYTTLPMWLTNRHPPHPPTPHCPHCWCHLICSGRTEAAVVHDRRRRGLHEPRQRSHCGAWPPCTFWYARHSDSMRDHKINIPWGRGTFSGSQPSPAFEPPSEKSKSCARPTMLCYSPRSFALPLSITDVCGEARPSITHVANTCPYPMGQRHIKRTALGCTCKQNGMSRRNYHKHDPAPFSPCNQSTTVSRCISNHKNRGQKKTRKMMVRQGPVLGQASACARGGRLALSRIIGAWDLG